MTSILTNNSAMVALQTLRSINQNLSTTQAEISSGKKVATAKDNASVFAISAVMQSDVSGFKAITESLSLGDASVGVARDGAETVTKLFNDLKGRIVASQESNVDRSKIQADVAELRNQVVATVDASQFNGLNLLKGDANNPVVSILGSLNRSDAGVSTSTINVNRQSLEAAKTAVTSTTLADGDAATTVFTVDSTKLVAGDRVAISLGFDSTGAGITVEYTVTQANLDSATADDDIATAVAAEATTRLADLAGSSDLTISASGADVQIAVTAGTPANPDLTVRAAAGGQLTALSIADVSTSSGAAAALDSIESLIQASVDAASTFGSAQKRIENQSNFLAKLTDSLTSGIGALVDVDLEAASARLQALQVQQQLGTQALSIANQQASSVLALFR